MKKLVIFLLLFTGLFQNSARADFFVYRKRGGQVISASITSQAAQLSSYFAETGNLSPADGKDLAIPKIWTGALVRNATAPEIAGFQANEDLDTLDAQRIGAKADLDAGQRRLMAAKALSLEALARFNAVHSWINSFKAQVALSTTLADLKTRVAALPDMPATITAAQFKTLLQNRIDVGDTD